MAIAGRILLDHTKEVTRQLQLRRHYAMHQFVGGPLNGQRHDGLPWMCVEVGTKMLSYGYLTRRIRSAEWAVYVGNPKDGRAFFHGYATSEKKARRKAFDVMMKGPTLEKAE